MDFVIFLTPQIISNPEEMRGATLRASGLTDAFVSADIIDEDAKVFPSGAPGMRPSLASMDMNPIEREVDRRFQELYHESVRKNRRQ